jgi:hypothetical protein
MLLFVKFLFFLITRRYGFNFFGNCPHEGAKFSGNCANDGLVFFTSGFHFAETATESDLSFPGNVANLFWQPLLTSKQFLADSGFEPVCLSCFDEGFPHMAVASLGYASGSPTTSAGVLGRYKTKVAHQLAGTIKAFQVAEFGYRGHCHLQ